MSKRKDKNLVKLPPGPAQKHGGFSFLSTGRLPRHRRYLLRYLSACRAGLVRDYGPTDQDLSTAQFIIIDRAIGKIGLLRCMEEDAREHGVMRGHSLAPALRASYLAYSNSLRLDLQALASLGGRKAEEALTFEEIIAEVEAAASKGQDVQARTEGRVQAQDEGAGVEPSREGTVKGDGGSESEKET